jgi:hypothetical protein
MSSDDIMGFARLGLLRVVRPIVAYSNRRQGVCHGCKHQGLLWCLGLCQTCYKRMRRGTLVVDASLLNSDGEEDKERQRRVKVYEARADAGLPLFGNMLASEFGDVR